ncbi:membrane protein [Pigmentiphaga soli]|uniref:Membrane protein n=1 Tax=Pigmentiphaga soli TaxID=1007095 RepID=A0ABP8GYF8_9BURK
MTDSRHTPAAAPAASAPPRAPFRHKALAGLLAFLLGWAGAHWWYLGRRGAWIPLLVSLVLIGTALRSPQWYFHPAFFLFLIPAVAGFIEALVLCLMPDAKFDARYNPDHDRHSHSGWPAILVAMATLAIGTAILMIGIVLMFQRIFELPN